MKTYVPGKCEIKEYIAAILHVSLIISTKLVKPKYLVFKNQKYENVVHKTAFNIGATVHLKSTPAWGGFLSNELIAEFDACFKKAVSWGYSCELKHLSGLLHEADEQLFRKMVNNKEHCTHQLLPPEKILPMKLCASNCIFALPRCHFNL